jgi:aspartyl protease family protein
MRLSPSAAAFGLLSALAAGAAADPGADGVATQAVAAPRAIVTIPADARGFFQVLAEMNGVPIRAVVDTGASAIYLGRTQAAALGVDTTRGRRSEMSTFRGPRTIWVVKLERVQVGGLVARDVDAWVVEEGEEGPPQPLLGMSFLARFEVRVAGGAMTLSERVKR